jgi:hypothetical protein
VGIGVYAWNQTHYTSYQDGRNLAIQWESGFAGAEPWTGCNHQDMASNGEVHSQGDARHIPGAAEPDDNYARWLAGCRSAKSYYRAQLKAGN